MDPLTCKSPFGLQLSCTIVLVVVLMWEGAHSLLVLNVLKSTSYKAGGLRFLRCKEHRSVITILFPATEHVYFVAS
jgi:hypothetical protein